MDTLATLLLAHLIADFPLQTNRIYALKIRSNAGIALHVGIHLAVTILLLKNALADWLLLLILAVSHFTLDWLKLRCAHRLQSPSFLLDQVAHVVILVAIAGRLAGSRPILPAWLVYPAIGYALILAIMVFAWVVANDLLANNLQRPEPTRPGLARWAQRRLLALSQLAGRPLLFGVAAGLFLAL
ncbi:MAG: DUF3307 domain-containing protein [Chloroflexi bacterium]|nr:DUF3307 domain-containing protein [Chloroflexota bacterium]MCI0644067.1 DUF3307 domain-containing protein [Chloroflexota bacterium]MCI0727883.1 DUF3307 domain-containing protein [Chloroflexota bacterium]